MECRIPNAIDCIRRRRGTMLRRRGGGRRSLETMVRGLFRLSVRPRQTRGRVHRPRTILGSRNAIARRRRRRRRMRGHGCSSPADAAATGVGDALAGPDDFLRLVERAPHPLRILEDVAPAAAPAPARGVAVDQLPAVAPDVVRERARLGMMIHGYHRGYRDAPHRRGR